MWISVKDAAERGGVTVDHMRRLVRGGAFTVKVMTAPRYYLIDLQSFQEWQNKRKAYISDTRRAAGYKRWKAKAA